MVSKLALGAIWGYQRYISPRKGWRCAYSVLHDGTGCSGYAKYAIRDHGVWGAIPQIRRRFQECREASATLRANCAVCNERPDDEFAELDPPNRKARHRKKSDRAGPCGTGLGCAECGAWFAWLPFGCAAGAQTADTPAPDSSSSCDLGGLDCSAPSCDGCGSCDCAPSCG